MNTTSEISEISRQGTITVSKIRFIIASFMGVVIVLGSSTMPPLQVAMNYIGLGIFIVLTIVNYLMAKRDEIRKWVRFVTVLVEISIPTMLKYSQSVTGDKTKILSESTLYTAYWIFILLSMLQNSRSLTLFSGFTAFAEYAGLVIFSVYYLQVPTTFGKGIPGYITLDDEIAKLIFFLGFTLISGVILRNLNAFAREAVNSGEIALTRTENLEKLIDNINNMNSDLITISTDLDGICDRFSNLSSEQAAMSEEFSSSYEEQYASIESINRSSSEQKSESLKSIELVRVLKKSQDAVTLQSNNVISVTERITGATEKTTRSLEQMIEKMEIIRQGGATITGFIDVINDITDRINLLSLNAAIEAARAGEHGRGFAVVADEIGKLATATSDNARQISSELAKIRADIESGASIVQLTRDATESVASAVHGISASIDQVKLAMQEQGRSIGDVGQQSETMENLATIISTATTEQHLSMEETSRTIQRLSDLAQEIAANTEIIVGHAKRIHHKVSEMESSIREIK